MSQTADAANGNAITPCDNIQEGMHRTREEMIRSDQLCGSNRRRCSGVELESGQAGRKTAHTLRIMPVNPAGFLLDILEHFPTHQLRQPRLRQYLFDNRGRKSRVLMLGVKDGPRCTSWQPEHAGLIIKAAKAGGDECFRDFPDFLGLEVGVLQTRHGYLPTRRSLPSTTIPSPRAPRNAILRCKKFPSRLIDSL